MDEVDRRVAKLKAEQEPETAPETQVDDFQRVERAIRALMAEMKPLVQAKTRRKVIFEFDDRRRSAFVAGVLVSQTKGFTRFNLLEVRALESWDDDAPPYAMDFEAAWARYSDKMSERAPPSFIGAIEDDYPQIAEAYVDCLLDFIADLIIDDWKVD